MRKQTPPAALLGPSTALLAALLLATVGGCASGPSEPQLTLHSTVGNRTLSPQFSSAYVTRDRNGDTDVVLLDRAAEGLMDGSRDTAPVRQVMHIRVLWNARSDMAGEHASASNASVHWYVMRNNTASACDVLEYAGTAFIVASPADGATELQIRNATIRPVACRGGLCDPIGSTTFQGAVRAIDDGRRVRQALDSVRSAVASAIGLPIETADHAKPELPSSLAR